MPQPTDTPPLTLMTVHAHPDDESISTGGVLARYSAEGVTTVLVTCTDGSCGDAPGGVKPGDTGHVPDDVVELRQAELQASCKVLGVTYLENLGYRDSGMMGWPQNDDPGSFWTTPVEEASSQLAVLMEKYRPHVVVTYDENGFYGHPDHIQAHRITMAAIEKTGIPAKLYFTAVPKSWFAELGQRLRELGVEFPSVDNPEDAAVPAEEGASGPEQWGTPDEEITTVVDVGVAVDQKFDSLTAHASQSDNIFFLQMGREAFGEIMTREAFVRVIDSTGAPTPEDDLFAGLR